MKNIVLFIAFLFSVISCSPEQPTTKDLIEKEFMIYVNQNFDNPKDLKEIVSINIKDTISYQLFKDLAQKSIDLMESTDSLTDARLLDISNIAKKSKQLDLNSFEKEKYSTMLLEYYDYIENKSLNCLKSKNILKHMIEKTDSCIDNFSYINYEIKVRKLVNNKIKLQKYYASVENNGCIKIYDEPITIADMPNQFKELVNALDDFNAEYKKRIENDKKIEEIFNFIEFKIS